MTTTALGAPPRASTPRVAAIDVMRGIVMVLMTTDHASEKFNHAHFFGDSVMFWKVGTPIDTAQFLTRWISHLCAPTFVALAGTALAISTESRRRRGQSETSIDRHIVTRGALLVAFEIAWENWALLDSFDMVLFQVLYALGASFIAMALLRRLGDRLLLALGLFLAFGTELLVGLATAAGIEGWVPVALTIRGGMLFGGKLIVGYPFVPWLGMMCLGWAFGRRLVAWRTEGKDESLVGARVLFVTGASFLSVFVVLRALNGFGNMRLLREGPDLVQWLHVSKYPPSATYVGLELGIAALLLAALMRFSARSGDDPSALAPVRLLGQTALFYYLLHVHLMKLVADGLGLHGHFGVASAYWGALLPLVGLYPACVWYRRYKTAHPHGWARWI